MEDMRRKKPGKSSKRRNQTINQPDSLLQRENPIDNQVQEISGFPIFSDSQFAVEGRIDFHDDNPGFQADPNGGKFRDPLCPS